VASTTEGMPAEVNVREPDAPPTQTINGLLSEALQEEEKTNKKITAASKKDLITLAGNMKFTSSDVESYLEREGYEVMDSASSSSSAAAAEPIEEQGENAVEPEEATIDIQSRANLNRGRRERNEARATEKAAITPARTETVLGSANSIQTLGKDAEEARKARAVAAATTAATAATPEGQAEIGAAPLEPTEERVSNPPPTEGPAEIEAAGLPSTNSQTGKSSAKIKPENIKSLQDARKNLFTKSALNKRAKGKSLSGSESNAVKEYNKEQKMQQNVANAAEKHKKAAAALNASIKKAENTIKTNTIISQNTSKPKKERDSALARLYNLRLLLKSLKQKRNAIPILTSEEERAVEEEADKLVSEGRAVGGRRKIKHKTNTFKKQSNKQTKRHATKTFKHRK
jgi:hypothetical protein